MVSIPIVETVVNLILWVMTTLGLPGLLLLMAVESFGIPPLPSEVILPFAGFLVATGDLPLGGAIAAAVAGGLIGSYVAYLVGRYARDWLTKGPAFLRLEPRHLDQMDRWFARHGEATVIGARLVPVIRSYVSYPAGTARMEPVRFGLFSLIGATPFTLALIYVGIQLGKNWSEILPIFHLLDYVVAGILAVLVLYVILRWRHIVTAGWPPHRVA
ncbi:MAG: DedA family protein [Thermoplasmata archaeon]|nr:DedA family protein [Thermoplasmata archaeon]